MKKLDEAQLLLDKAQSFEHKIEDKQKLLFFKARYHDAVGQLLMEEGKYQEALKEFILVNKLSKEANSERYFSIYMDSYIALCYQKLGDLKKSIFYGERSYKVGLYAESRWKIKNSLLLSEVYEESGQFKKAFEYLKKYKNHIKENEEQAVANLESNLAIENFTQKNEQEKASYQQEKLIKQQEIKNQRWWLFSIAAALLSSVVFLYFLYRNNQQKHKANTVLENTLTGLKSTQAQLIQSEKMASLGELTAGIAHEIQNPLNFVINFSELSKEMAEELLEEAQKPEIDKALISGIATDIVENQEKINHHGNRASSIVKGMLEHSRSSSGKKELTDINALAAEYLRLAYHGLRAKDKSFNADFKTHFDSNLPKVEVVSQDIGRVLLNLINNAFQAVAEKEKLGLEGYKPGLVVATQKTAKGIEISITDNGPGIPDEIKDKIFQPFFTTKDTGKGTGLGLSLAYDIVKAHGGELTVNSGLGEGSEFIISLLKKS